MASADRTGQCRVDCLHPHGHHAERDSIARFALSGDCSSGSVLTVEQPAAVSGVLGHKKLVMIQKLSS